MAPSEFWALSPREFSWLLEAYGPRRTDTWAGSLTDDDVKDLVETLRDHE
jgi:hypothetical protein